MYVQSPIGGLILYMDNYFKFIETISLEVKYIYKKNIVLDISSNTQTLP
jgi:uncharacterized protein YqgQ